MTLARAKECHDLYTEDTETVAVFLRDKGEKFRCPLAWLKRPQPDEKNRLFTLRLANFLRIAEHLSKQSAFSVPPHIKRALDRDIDLRSECNGIHERLNPKNTTANESHKYPIRILKEVREVLLPKLSSGPVDSSAEAQELSDMNEPQAAGVPSNLVVVGSNSSILLDGLKRIRQAVQRCWSSRKSGVIDGNRV